MLGLNQNHNHDLKNIFKSAALSPSALDQDRSKSFTPGCWLRGEDRLWHVSTLARKIAAITLTIWKKGVCFDANELHRQAA